VIDTVHLLLKESAIIQPVTDNSSGYVDRSVRPEGLTNDELGGFASEGFTRSLTFGTGLSPKPA
jgi:hypothetical protein